ncbi:MAG: hypothetical protein IJB37_02680 [Peptococcaceae bacterium]|nr:hypothetical protein [Peptococcaceae bacterium]
MSGVDRDIQCGNNFAKLYELGCFDEEFIVYGCGYFQNGEIMYLVSDDGDKVYRFRNESLRKHIYTTPVIMKLKSCQVSSGERDNIRQNIKFELAKEIKAQYSEAYYRMIAQMDAVESNQQAERFLQEEQRNMEGYFDRSGVEQFEGLCNLAYEQKKISDIAYQQFCTWIKYAKRQMENDIVIKDDMRRIFYGLGYELNGQMGYFADAQAMNVYKKRENLLLQGAIVTPIISKEYWFKSINQLANIRKMFLSELQIYVDASYMKKTKKILQFASPYENLTEINNIEQLQKHEKEAMSIYQRMIGMSQRTN